jgi:hypothetical protein
MHQLRRSMFFSTYTLALYRREADFALQNGTELGVLILDILVRDLFAISHWNNFVSDFKYALNK